MASVTNIRSNFVTGADWPRDGWEAIEDKRTIPHLFRNSSFPLSKRQELETVQQLQRTPLDAPDHNASSHGPKGVVDTRNTPSHIENSPPLFLSHPIDGEATLDRNSDRQNSLTLTPANVGYCASSAPRCEKRSSAGQQKETASEPYRDYSCVPSSSFVIEREKSANGVHVRFPERLHKLLEDAEQGQYSDIVAWQPHGRAFMVFDKERFLSYVLPKHHFKQTQFASFTRQLSIYGFRRMKRPSPDQGSYYHPFFLRGRPEMCIRMEKIEQQKIKTKGRNANAPHEEQEPNFYTMPTLMDQFFSTVENVPSHQRLKETNCSVARASKQVELHSLGDTISLGASQKKTIMTNGDGTVVMTGGTSGPSGSPPLEISASPERYFYKDSPGIRSYEYNSVPVRAVSFYEEQVQDEKEESSEEKHYETTEQDDDDDDDLSVYFLKEHHMEATSLPVAADILRNIDL